MNILAVVMLAAANVAAIPPEGIIHIRLWLTQAHGCAVRPDIMLTARHVIENDREDLYWHVAWSDLAGNEGRAILLDGDLARDVVMLRVTAGVPGRTYALATAAPKPGDRVRIAGYDERHPAKPKVVETDVIAVDAGHVFYRKSPGPGSSGGCVLNEADEVVAVNHAYRPDSDGSVKWGQGISVYGIWAPTLPPKEEK